MTFFVPNLAYVILDAKFDTKYSNFGIKLALNLLSYFNFKILNFTIFKNQPITKFTY